ncbi:MAG: putative 2OG-Fe(II) oxygenase [Cyanobacteriota bacterium]|nr:putative 2OG-Fe(II) oxygenase [Cyanobacteriota bacterium]
MLPAHPPSFGPLTVGTLSLRPLFPLALGQVQLAPDPLETAVLLQDILGLRGEATGNPQEGCAWTGDLHGAGQLHHHPAFAPLLGRLAARAADYVEALGFERSRVALHLQRAWPVVSDMGQGIGRHHHPNAHLSAIYYLTGDGTGASGCLRIWAPVQANELVPGLAVGHGGPITGADPGARAWNAPGWDVAPQAGLMVLFPASVDHGVLENGCYEERRVSIAMDFCLTAPAPPQRQRKGSLGERAGDGEEAEYLAPHPSAWREVGEFVQQDITP